MALECNSCKKSPPEVALKRWAYNGKVIASEGLEQGVIRPFTRLENRTWLHDRSERDVYGLLIDAYRLRVEDMYNIEGEADADSIYGGAANGLRGFKRFLERVERCPALLPPWWDAKKKKECETLGMTPSQWHDLRSAVERAHHRALWGFPIPDAASDVC
ncbi:uncharacterized protein HRG_12007 [Hirsutella rhossiliensis]|uniref:Uncharacterized protein n=1 Tax=Hirsutella rhossiliensis TaxID=111463 RepID=A0A9P8SCH7_9HYPO|nr:uncharacterized protein HRG_12007 [Hirsutella rhossiliensis]KAH0956914.1 hypothetical protein HRG_12007 [Hirsutella rhossiliensis]